jgi:hypothetical protein
MDSLSSILGRSNTFFSIPQHSDRLWDSLSGYRRSFPGSKHVGHEADHSYSASVERGAILPLLFTKIVDQIEDYEIRGMYSL